MPLPTDTTLSLLAYPNLQGKPKKAMLVRLSAETLDALESFTAQPQVQFEFGDSPGIYIGDTHFPMNHWEEKSANELYLRSLSGNKKTAPLKLHANVIGKFAVERELADNLRDKIRESTQVAADQRNRPTTKFIDTPPDTLQPSKKKTSTTLFRNPPRPADKPKPAPPPPAPVPSNRTSSSTPSQRDGVPLRKRLVHCLAVSEKPEDQLLKMLGASDRSSSLRNEIFDLLDELADVKPGSERSHKVYQLKPIGWKEVRPHEWPRLTDQEKIQMSRSARIAMNALRIPESDPIWNHFKSSPGTSSATPYATASSSTTSASKQDAPVPKRGVSSHEVKEKKKQKPKADPKAEIMMKDESLRATNRDPPSAIRMTDSSRPAQEPIRRQHQSSANPVKTNPRPSAVDERTASSSTKTSRQERPVASSVASSKPSLSQTGERKLSTQARKVRREEFAQYSDSDRERHSVQGDKPRPKKKEVEYAEPKPPVQKRKAVDHDDDEYDDRSARQKKRKSDPQAHASLTSREDKVRDPPRKPMVESRPESRPSERGAERDPSSSAPRKRRPSPPPPAQAAKRVSSSNARDYSETPSSSKHTSTSGSATKAPAMKKKRVSPIYTSSEDDKEDEAPLSKRVPTKSAPPPPPAISSTASYSSRTPRPLPTDHASLRARYDDSYVDYLQSLGDLMKQKGKLTHLLKNNDGVRAGSITDSDGDVELLGPEDLERLTTRHRRLHEELQTIQQIFSQAVKSEPISD